MRRHRFRNVGVGDPSSDLVMAWNFFDDVSRKIFLSRMNVDEDTVDRARGWALWKALITCASNGLDSEAANWGRQVLEVIIQDYKLR